MLSEQKTPGLRQPCLTILVNRDQFFLSHFLDRALTARDAGYRVHVLCPDTGRRCDIEAAGLQFWPLPMSRHGTGLVDVLRTIWAIRCAYMEIQPDVIWQIGLKPLMLGTVAAKLAGVHRIVNAPVGMGFVFSSNRLKARLARAPVKFALKRLLNPQGSKVVFENPDDLDEMRNWRAVRSQDAILIRGAGVNLKVYTSVDEPNSVPIVLLAARLIWEKGVGEFVSAARVLRNRGIKARFQIAGGIDRDSTSAVPEEQIAGWVKEGLIEWLGPRNDMPQVLAASHIFCLPSWYREGLPKVILEAMASGRPVIATNMPGCREAVRDGENGLLVAPRDVSALVEALAALLTDPAMRQRFGRCGRELAKAEFSTERVCQETLRVFDQVAFRHDRSSTDGVSL